MEGSSLFPIIQVTNSNCSAKLASHFGNVLFLEGLANLRCWKRIDIKVPQRYLLLTHEQRLHKKLRSYPLPRQSLAITPNADCVIVNQNAHIHFPTVTSSLPPAPSPH